MSHVKCSPDVVGACAKALLAAQRAAIVVHEIAKELPSCWHLVALDSLALCHPTCKHPQSRKLPPGLNNATVTPLGLLQCSNTLRIFASLAHQACAKAFILSMGHVRYNLGDTLVRDAVLHWWCILCSLHNGWTYS